MLGVGEAKWRDAISVWEPCCQSAPWADNGGYSRTPRCCGLQYAGYSPCKYFCAVVIRSPFAVQLSSHPLSLLLLGSPKGFGVTARSTVDTRKLDPTSILVYHQAYVLPLSLFSKTHRKFVSFCFQSDSVSVNSDAGEYLRDEDTLF